MRMSTENFFEEVLVGWSGGQVRAAPPHSKTDNVKDAVISN